MEIIQKVATRALILFEDKVLIIRESQKYNSPNKGKWDFPGGKVEIGENFKEGLIREVKEEVGLVIQIGNAFSIQEWRPIVNNMQFQIIGTFIECFTNSNDVILSEDHDKYLWINLNEFEEYDLLECTKNAFIDYFKNK